MNRSIDPNRGAVKQATTLAAHFPDYPRLLGNVKSRVGGIVSGGASVDFARDDPADTELAFLGHYLAFGQDVSLRAAPQHGAVGAIGALLDTPALGGAAVSVSPARGGARLKVHTVLDPELAQSLGAEPGFRAVVGAHQQRVGSLLFLDLSQLLGLGEQMGLTHSARLGALGPDLDEISAAGLTSTGGKADTTAELFLQIP